MNYSYILKNEERILRPVTVDDAEFIVKLRNQPHVGIGIHATSTDVEKQRQWIRDYLKRDNEYYWIIETLDHRPYGTTSLYNYNEEKRQMESGRWVKLADAPVVNMFADRIQVNDFVFNLLGVKRIVFDVVAINRKVLQWHRLCGAIETGIEHGKVEIHGKSEDVIWFEETSENWKINRIQLCQFAGMNPKMRFGTIEKVMI